MRFRRASVRDRGAALLLALLVLVLVSVVASLVAAAVSLEMRFAQHEAQRIRCGALADAAMARALAELSRSRSYRGHQGERLGGGSLSIEVTRPSGPLDRRRVVATGHYAGRARSLEAFVSLDPTGRLRVTSWRVLTRRERERQAE